MPLLPPFKLPAPFALRPMTLADIDAVMAIEAVAMPSPWSEKGYRNELKRNKQATYQILTYTDPQHNTPQIIGYVGHWLIIDEVHISIIATHPDWRGFGLGEAMLTSVIWIAVEQQAQAITLEVRENNTVAQNLYRKHSFAHVGTRKRYYRDTNEDGYIMTAAPLDAAFVERLQAYWRLLYARLCEKGERGAR